MDGAGGAANAVVGSELMVHIKVYALAEKYLIGGLRSLALEKFQTQASKAWNTDGFLEAAQAVYELTMESNPDTGLRSVVVRTFAQHSGLLDKESTKDVLVNASCLAHDILSMYIVWESSEQLAFSCMHTYLLEVYTSAEGLKLYQIIA